MIGRHRRKRETTTASYDAMLIRMLSAYRKRVRQDPDVALADLRQIEQALTDAVNLGLHDALSDGRSPTYLAGILGVSRQAIYKRAGLGEQAARRQARQQTQQQRTTLQVADRPEPRELTQGDPKQDHR